MVLEGRGTDTSRAIPESEPGMTLAPSSAVPGPAVFNSRVAAPRDSDLQPGWPGECDHLNWPRSGLLSSLISAPPGW